MSKRKQKVPQRASEDKRLCLEWNMLDGVSPEGSLYVLEDNDPTLAQEAQQAQEVNKGDNSAARNSTPNETTHFPFLTQQKQDLFDDNLKFCSYYLKVLECLPFGEKEWHAVLGVFHVKLLPGDDVLGDIPDNGLPEGQEVWLYASDVEGKSMLYFEQKETDENRPTAKAHSNPFTFWNVNVDIPLEVLAGLDQYNSKIAAVTLGQYDPATLTVELYIHAREAILCQPKFPSEHVKLRKHNLLLLKVMSHFYGLAPPVYDEESCTRKHDVEALYNVVKETHDKEEITVGVEVQHQSLIPQLRPYQRRGVAWMLSKEGFKVAEDSVQSQTNGSEPPLHMLYDEVTTLDGSTVYYNAYFGSMTREHQVQVVTPPGGILADEMGLGKTVEVLACMLLHRSPAIELPTPLPTLEEMKSMSMDEADSVSSNHSDVVVVASQSDVKMDDTEVKSQSDIKCQKDVVVISEVLVDTDLSLISNNKHAEVLGPCDVNMGDVSMTSNDKAHESEGQNDIQSEETINKGSDTDDCEIVEAEVKGQGKVKVEGEGLCGQDKADNCDETFSTEHGNTLPNIYYIKKDISMATNFENTELQIRDNFAKSERLMHKENMPESVIVIDGDQDGSPVICGPETGDVIVIEPTGQDGGVCAVTENQPRRSGRKRKRTKWTWKKQPRKSSHCSVEMDETGHSSMEEADGVTSTGNKQDALTTDDTTMVGGSTSADGSTSALTQHDTLASVVGQANRVTKARSKKKGKKIRSKAQGKRRPNSKFNVKTDCNPNPVEKKIKSRKSCPRQPSRFVQLVEESAFECKNMFSASLPVRPKEFFECICGVKIVRVHDKRHPVQCVGCGLWQHAECVHYDLDDPYRGEFRCPHCHVSLPPMKSSATLIISPSSICHQWVDEILKHIRSQSLKVFVYTGVNKQGFIQPRTLAQQDIVITTYETLRKEIDYVDLPHSNCESGRKFRHPKRFMAVPSPMTAVEWWRVCLDEAQMVECTTTKTAEMALRLSAVNRWCVTGTPIQKSLGDMYGLLLFLGLDPYWVRHWWTTLLYEPYCHGNQEPLHKVLASVLWRNAKKDVLDQINIPKQTEHMHWLTFSPVEDHFYRRQYQDCAMDARRSFSKWSDLSTKLSSLDRHTVGQLLYPLLKLRQACCHPQAVRGEFLPLQKNTMTMEELLESLTKKAQLECEESHRQLVASLNGMAGLHIIRTEYGEAVEMYREVLWSVEEHKEELRTDKLQLLHTLYNLHEILSLKPEGVAPTLRDDQLKQQADDMREKYMSKAAAKVTASQTALTPTQENVVQLKVEMRDGLEWWLEVIKYAEDRQTDEVLVDMVKSELLRDYVDDHVNPHVSMARLFHGSRGLELTLDSRVVALESAHHKLLEGIEKLCEPVTRDLVNKSVECCLRPVGDVLRSCQLCLVDKLFQDYESKLFSFNQKRTVMVEGDHPQTPRRQGTWADSDTEKSLKVILSFAKLYKAGRYIVEFGTTHIKLFDMLKKEFKNLRAVWMSKHEQFQAMDELDMATTRLRLRLPDEDTPDTTQLNIIEPSELQHQRIKLQTEKTVAKNELRKKLGQLFYLKNLSKTQIGNEDGVNPEPCPICQRELGVEWSVLQCGHCYCLECIRVMVVQFSFGSHNRRLKCAVCRQLIYHTDISYVSTKVTDDDEAAGDIRVKGSYSTKIEGVVRCLLTIHRDDPTAKVLIFSTWTSVLSIISQALDENNLTYRTLYTGKFQNQLNAFREENVTTLLLPIQSGANGLNLIEATYVLLVEPILNPAQELQAIGRVHRIGQTRKTQVHRFVIRGTIEQKMYSMLKTIEDAPSSHSTEENVLTIGHLTSLLREDGDKRVADNSTNTTDSQGQDVAVDDARQMDDMVTSSSPSGPVAGPSTSGQDDTGQGHDEDTSESHDSGSVCVVSVSSDRSSDVMCCDSDSFTSGRGEGSESDDSNGPIGGTVTDDNVGGPIKNFLSGVFGASFISDVIDLDSEEVEEVAVVVDDKEIVDLTSITESEDLKVCWKENPRDFVDLTYTKVKAESREDSPTNVQEDSYPLMDHISTVIHGSQEISTNSQKEENPHIKDYPETYVDDASTELKTDSWTNIQEDSHNSDLNLTTTVPQDSHKDRPNDSQNLKQEDPQQQINEDLQKSQDNSQDSQPVSPTTTVVGPREDSQPVSPTTTVVVPREDSQPVSPTTAVVGPREDSQPVSPTTAVVGPREDSQPVTPTSTVVGPREDSQPVSPTTAVVGPREDSQPVSPTTAVVGPREDSQPVSPTTTVVVPREDSQPVSPTTAVVGPREDSQPVSPTTAVVGPREDSQPVTPTSTVVGPREDSQPVSPTTAVVGPREDSQPVSPTTAVVGPREDSQPIVPTTTVVGPREDSQPVTHTTAVVGPREDSQPVSPTTTVVVPREDSQPVTPTSTVVGPREDSQPVSPTTTVVVPREDSQHVTPTTTVVGPRDDSQPVTPTTTVEGPREDSQPVTPTTTVVVPREDSQPVTPTTAVVGPREDSQPVSPTTTVVVPRGDSQPVTPTTAVVGPREDSQPVTPTTTVVGPREDSQPVTPTTAVVGPREDSQPVAPTTAVVGPREDSQPVALTTTVVGPREDSQPVAPTTTVVGPREDSQPVTSTTTMVGPREDSQPIVPTTTVVGPREYSQSVTPTTTVVDPREDSQLVTPKTTVVVPREDSQPVTPTTTVVGPREDSQPVTPTTTVVDPMEDSQPVTPTTTVVGPRENSQPVNPTATVVGPREDSQPVTPTTTVVGPRKDTHITVYENPEKCIQNDSQTFVDLTELKAESREVSPTIENTQNRIRGNSRVFVDLTSTEMALCVQDDPNPQGFVDLTEPDSPGDTVIDIDGVD